MAKKTKRVKRSPRGVIYSITAKGKINLPDVKGQGKIVFQVLNAMRKAAAKELQKRIGKRLKTRKPGNVMASYLTKWRQKGLVTARAPKRG